MQALRLAAAVAAATLWAATAAAQTTLRIGLAEDPDVLDPTLARTYVGRIVFASLCDKLFDIDDKLNIVPQLALSSDISEDGKTVVLKLRSGVKFHDGATMDEARFVFSHAAAAPEPASWCAGIRTHSSLVRLCTSVARGNASRASMI